MTNRGKSINLFLIDGDARGRIKCTLANWTGIAYKIPRTELEKSKDREDLKNSGVYFLFGKSDDFEKNPVYIGQAGSRKNGEGILNRLLEHKKNVDKDYFTEVVCFTTVSNYFGPTEISYLENRFCKMTKTAGRYEVKNEKNPSLGNVTEEKESELEEFIDYSKIIMGTLGHKIFIPLTEVSNNENQSDDKKQTILYLERKTKKSNTEIKGLGIVTDEGFVVLKGSVIERKDSYHISEKLKEVRKNAKLDGDKLAVDMLFGSPSTAAMFVLGASANGLIEWKDENGKKLRDL